MNNNSFVYVHGSHEFAELKTEIGRCHTAIIHTNLFKDGFTTILMPCTRFNSKWSLRWRYSTVRIISKHEIMAIRMLSMLITNLRGRRSCRCFKKR